MTYVFFGFIYKVQIHINTSNVMNSNILILNTKQLYND